MLQLPAWVIVALREPLDAAALIERARALGVSIEPTRDGLALPGGFLAWLAPPPSGAQLDSSLTSGEISLGPVALHISGGTNELEREAHQRPLAERALSAELLRAVMPSAPAETRVESAASRKMTRFTEQLCALSPLAAAVVLPFANSLVLGADEHARHARSLLNGNAYPFPAWAFLKVRGDAPGAHLATCGMGTYALPEVAAALAPGSDAAEVARMLGAAQREMVAEGLWPADGDVLQTQVGPLRVSTIFDAIWIEGPDTPDADHSWLHFARLRCMQVILGSCTHHRLPAADGHPAVEHFLRGEASVALTNGLSDGQRPGAAAEDPDARIEVMLHSPALGPWADFWLRWAAASIRMSTPERPVQPYDRLVLDQPRQGIAGVILWPAGQLRLTDAGGPDVELWDLLPITPAELTTFRQQPDAQGRWLDERDARQDFAALRHRWHP